MIFRASRRAVSVCAVTLGLAPLAASADQARAKTLAGLTVTAQKREEAMQDVPIAVAALSGQTLRDNGVRDIKDLQWLVPGLIVTSTQGAGQTVARIRGIGTVGDNAGLESSVGVVIDGVYRPRTGVGYADLGEIERIEVLKGPQGTVFGKNASAGVINVVTRRPGRETAAEGELTVGDRGALGVAGSFNAPLGERAALRVYAAKRERDGFSRVETGRGPRAEREDGDQNLHTLRGQLSLRPSDGLALRLIADYSSREENCCVAFTTVRGPSAAILDALAGGSGVAPKADPFARRAWSNRPTTQDIKDKGVSAEIDWATPWFGGATLTSIAAAREWNAIGGLDFDFSAADLIYRNPDREESFTGFAQSSQELRLTGATERLDWMVGLFHAEEELQRNDSYRVGAQYEPYLSTAVLRQIAARFPVGTVDTANAGDFLARIGGRPPGANFAGAGALDRYRQDSRSLALFANNTWHASDRLDLSLGLRYTREDKRLDSVYRNPNGGLGCGAALANQGRIAQALAARGVPSAVRAALAQQVLGFMCLPWANPRHDGRTTRQQRDEREWSGTVKAAYRWNEHLMGYASAARGHKAGGFNLDRVQSSNGLSAGTAGILPVDDTSFPGEFVDSYELGARTTWAGGNLLLNATLFHQAYSGFQLNNFLGASFVVRSIPRVVSKGIDTEALWQTAVEGLTLQGGLTYADTRHGNDPLPDADLARLPGARLSFAPLWSATATASYQRELGERLLGRLSLGVKYSGEYSGGTDLDPEKHQDAYTVVNARAGIGAANRRWTVEAWALNLFDQRYKQVGFDAPLQTGSWNAFLGAPRTYGVTLRVGY